MTGKLNQLELIAAVKTILCTVSEMVFYEQNEDDVMCYRDILENAGEGWEVEILGPSKEYDIVKKRDLYGLRIKRRVGEDA